MKSLAYEQLVRQEVGHARRLRPMQAVNEQENRAGAITFQATVITTFIALLSHVPADHSMTQVSSLSSARLVAFAA